jgi:photosystem II stability/assembly factor-like uncharacterized protein
MKKQRFSTTFALTSITTALILLLSLLGRIPFSSSTPAHAAPASLEVTSVDPNTAPNDLDTPILIGGAGFSATPVVYLGDTALTEVTWVDAASLSAVVPWGMAPGDYPLTVVNPDEVSATLPAAFTVTAGLGEFVSGGPYGGRSTELALGPGDPATVYAAMFGAGLFISEDSAETWDPIDNHDWPIHLDFDAQDPDVLYFGADSNDLFRSTDNGASWVRLTEDIYTINGCYRTYPAAHPSTAGVVYFAMGSCGDITLSPGEGGIYYSTDYGDTWTKRVTGLTDLDVQALAIHPSNPDTLLAGTYDGDIFYSQDGGLSWNPGGNLSGIVSRLYFNPYQSLQAWAGVIVEDGSQPPGRLYRSTNLTSWTPIHVDLSPQGGPVFMQMAFLPGSVWVASQFVYFSTDSGANWDALPGPDHAASSLAILPENPQTIYVGTDFGVEKSEDGGATWAEVNEGLAALVPQSIAVSSADPDTVYVKTHQGVFASHNGGNAWQYLDYGNWAPSHSQLAVDAFSARHLYLGAKCADEFCIDISSDAGLTWDQVASALPPAYVGWSCTSLSITPSPHAQGHVLVGASLTPAGGGDAMALFYRSDDYGEHWSYIEPTQPIKPIDEIAYDAFNANLVYAATAGSGLWRSTNGGDSWTHLPVADVASPVHIADIAVHPNLSGKLYIRTYSYDHSPNPEPDLWVSEDAGTNWQPLTYVFLGVDLLVAPPLPGQLSYTIYTGCEAGLCRSFDDGATWFPTEGFSRPEILTVASDGQRSLIYLGAPGGLATSTEAQAAQQSDVIPGRGSVLGSGVYRLTTLLQDHWLFLPGVSLRSAP